MAENYDSYTRKWAKEAGWSIEYVERRTRFCKFDFLGIADWLIWNDRNASIVALQVTNDHNKQAHINKILDQPKGWHWLSRPEREIWLMTWNLNRRMEKNDLGDLVIRESPEYEILNITRWHYEHSEQLKSKPRIKKQRNKKRA